MSKELLSIGEVAKMMNITVRTLQYYDKENVLKPSCMSEGGRRLYSAKDIVKLHQVLSFKYLGFSLEEIRNKIFAFESPEEVAASLALQSRAIEQEIAQLTEALNAIYILRQEVETSKTIDYTKYAEIIGLLKLGNDGFWAWDCFERDIQTHIRDRFQKEPETGVKLYHTFQQCLDDAIMFIQQAIPPQSEQGKALGKTWWDMIQTFTGGNQSLLPSLESFSQNREQWDPVVAKKQEEAEPYLIEALEYYFKCKEEENECN